MATNFPVIEVFGPTVQGEGFLIGQQTHFVRFGGCDYRCSWCDTLYAVEPEQVRRNATKMTAEQIVAALVDLAPAPLWVTLSGGNPALFPLADLVKRLHAAGYRVTAETQGSLEQPWLADLDHLTLSPKPPSSGMRPLLSTLDRLVALPNASVKIVVFGPTDLAWAKDLVLRYQARGSTRPFFFQVGNHVGEDGTPALLAKLDWLTGAVLADPDLRAVAVLPQLHVLLWGNKRGV